MNSKDPHKISIWSKIFFFILGFVDRIVIFLILGFRLRTDSKVREWKRSGKSFIILSAHPSELDAVALLAAGFPRYTRFLVGAQQLYRGLQGKILRALHSIPKRQFTPDLKAVKEILRSVKNGNVIGMMPEGRVSMDGTMNPIDEATAKLIKKLEVPVAVLVPHGTYFVKPPYNSKGLRLGKISAEMKAFLDADEIKELSNDEIMGRLRTALSYDTAKELRGSGRTYGPKNKPYMSRVSHMLYRCPKCGKLYTMRDDGRKLFCTDCGLSMDLSREMFFLCEDKSLPDNISDWNRMQIEFEHSFWKDENAFLSSPARKAEMTLGKDLDFSFCNTTDGKLTLDREGFHYSDSEESLDLPLSILPGISADYGNGFITIYQGDLIRRLYVEEPRMVARFVDSMMVLKGLK